MGFPKAEDIRKNKGDKKTIDKNKYYLLRVQQISKAIMDMSQEGYEAIHLNFIKKLGAVDPAFETTAIEELEENGFRVIETEMGHQIEWGEEQHVRAAHEPLIEDPKSKKRRELREKNAKKAVSEERSQQPT